ncbi:MAG: biopolymer transporter ExbD [Litoreibacter sp.]
MPKARKRRRRLSMTSLIDVIFLLLLFFMLTSTFSHFSEVELAAAAGSGATASTAPPLFMQLTNDTIRLNGEQLELEALNAVFRDKPETTLIVSLQDNVDAQRLTDLLVRLRAHSKLTITVLGAS